jgi:deoxyribodipyrimidine photo-lyase
MPNSHTALVWLRRDLRLDDHAAFFHALEAASCVHVAFVFDTAILDSLPRADRRVEFIHGSVAALKTELERHGSSLHALHANAREAIPELARQLRVDTVYCNRDYEPAATDRDQAVATQLAQSGIGFQTFKDQVIFETDEILTLSGTPFAVFTPYKNAWHRKLDGSSLNPYPVTAKLAALARLAPCPMPSLAELGFVATNLSALAIPGSAGASRLLDDFLERIDHYREARDFPAVKGPSYLSVHLRFGTVSIRRLATLAHARSSAGCSDLAVRVDLAGFLPTNPAPSPRRRHRSMLQTRIRHPGLAEPRRPSAGVARSAHRLPADRRRTTPTGPDRLHA